MQRSLLNLHLSLGGTLERKENNTITTELIIHKNCDDYYTGILMAAIG
jgi:hypothetical protein